MPDHKLPIGSNRCKCTTCGRYFSAPSSFEAHWRRPKGTPDGAGDGCFDPVLAGLVERSGYWSFPAMDQSAISAFSVGPGSDETPSPLVARGAAG